MFDKELKTRGILVTFLAIAMALSWILSFALIDDNLFFEFYGEQMSYEHIVDLIAFQKQWSWLQYPLIPIAYLLKFCFVAGLLLVGFFLVDVKARFQDAFRVALEAEFVLLIPSVIKLIWFGAVQREYTITELAQFSALSLRNVISPSEQWLSPVLQSISIFELAYWILLAVGVKRIYDRSFSASFGLVAASYGSGWLAMQVLIIFVGVNFSA